MELIKKFKDRKYSVSSNKNIKLILFILIIIFGYAFFLLSNLFISGEGNLKYTKLDEQQDFENCQITINRWDYSPSQNIMEIELGIEKHDYTEKQSFSFSAVSRPENNELKVKKQIERNDFFIIHISEIKDNWKEISLRIDMNYNDKSSNQLKLYSNYKRINKVDSIKNMSEKDYLIKSLKTKLKSYNNHIDELNDTINKNNKNIDEYNKKIEELSGNKKYLTNSQIDEMNDNISDIYSKIDDINAENGNLLIEIDEYKQKIAKAEQQLNDLN